MAANMPILLCCLPAARGAALKARRAGIAEPRTDRGASAASKLSQSVTRPTCWRSPAWTASRSCLPNMRRSQRRGTRNSESAALAWRCTITIAMSRVAGVP
jgi:hypothetical protein